MVTSQLYNVISGVPNFLLDFLFGPLASQLKKLTGKDVMEIDISEKIKQLDVPAYFVVTKGDKVAGRDHVRGLFMGYKGRRGSRRGVQGYHRDGGRTQLRERC